MTTIEIETALDEIRFFFSLAEDVLATTSSLLLLELELQDLIEKINTACQLRAYSTIRSVYTSCVINDFQDL